MVQVVIDIPEKYREAFEKNRCKEKFDSMCTNEFGYVLRKAFENGTPLPKGHGDLIDRSKIKFFGCDVIKNCHSDCSICGYAGCYRDDVMSLQKIVPADKEE